MSKKQTEFGNEPFDFLERQFVFAEAVEITGVPPKDLNNWTQRGLIDIGEMHKTGRRLYSVADLIELGIVTEMSTFAETPASLAVAVAKHVKPRMLEMLKRDASGQPVYRGTKHSPRHFIRVWFENGNHNVAVHEGTDWLTLYGHEHPFVCIPLDEIIMKIQKAAIRALEREWNKRQQRGDDE